MREIFLTISIIFISVIFTLNAQSQNTLKYSKAKVYFNKGELNKLASLGIAVDNGTIKKDQFIISDFSENEIKTISENGFRYEILVEDVSKYYEERNKNANDSIVSPKKKGINAAACSVDKYQTPQYFSLGSVGGYYSYEEIMTELDSMRQRFPNLVTIRQQVGSTTTIEGRKIWMVKISDNPDIDETEPEVLYSALTHAREPMGMQQLFFYMYYLLENYNSNSTVKYIVDNTELYFVPCVNPDGYKLNQTTNPNGGGMQRKNCRQVGSPIGIDLNRNYGFQWGYDDVGSSPNQSDETYRGTSGFSEAETQIMKAFDESKNFKLCIDYHCYSNVLIYPWSYDNLLTPDSAIFRKYAQIMTKNNGFAYGTPFQTLGYNANGGSVDWFYGEQSTKNKIMGFSPEAGDGNDGFWPQISRIEPIAKSFAEMNFYLALFAGKYAEISDANPKFLSSSGYLKFDVNSLGLDTPATFTISIIPTNSSIISVGSPVSINNMHFLQSSSDSINVTLSPSLTPGQTISYVYKVQNSYGFYFSDTITKIFGTPIDIFADAANNMTNWTSTTWNTTTMSYYSPTKSFVDSPYGNYADNANTSITLNSYINLSGYLYAELSFWAKWDIEAGWDYVEVFASTNGTLWTPLCGKYNHPGNSYQDVDQPIYDGTQSTWVKEQIDLTNYLGQNVKFRLKLKSDYNTNYDGFYFDDIKVSVINTPTNIDVINQNNNSITLYPNPCNNEININLKSFTNPIAIGSNIEIYNSLGKKIRTIQALKNKKSINISTIDFALGIYFVKIIDETGSSKTLKFIKQ